MINEVDDDAYMNDIDVSLIDIMIFSTQVIKNRLLLIDKIKY